MTNTDQSGNTAVVARPMPTAPQYGQQPYGAWQDPQDANPVVMRTMTEYRAGAWAQAPGAPYGYVAPGFDAAPRIERPRRPRWFWPVILTAAGVVALLGGGAAGFAIGHSIDVGGTSQTQTTTPGGGTGTFPGGGTGTFPGGGTGTFGGGTGTGTGSGSGSGSGSTSGQNS
jgi:hypothetical protein